MIAVRLFEGVLSPVTRSKSLAKFAAAIFTAESSPSPTMIAGTGRPFAISAKPSPISRDVMPGWSIPNAVAAANAAATANANLNFMAMDIYMMVTTNPCVDE